MKKEIINQIPVCFRNQKEYEELVDTFTKLGYKLYEINEATKYDLYPGIVVDIAKKIIFPVNATPLCLWSRGERSPLNGKELVENIERFVINQDVKLYDQMTKQKYKDPSSPRGIIAKF